MWTIPGLVIGLVLMLLASAETNGGNQQSPTSDTALRVEFNDAKMLQEVNTGSIHYSDSHIPILIVIKSFHRKKLLLILSMLLQIKLIFFKNRKKDTFFGIFYRMILTTDQGQIRKVLLISIRN